MRCVLLFCAAGFAQMSSGQVIPDQINRNSERLQERERERQRERDEQFRQSQLRPPSASSVSSVVEPASEPHGCAAVRMITLKGMVRYAPRDFAPTLDKLKGDCVSIADIDAALRTITNRYIGDGFVTSRAVIGPQDLKSGTLEIVVVEGELEGIVSKPSGAVRGYSRGELATAFPGTRGHQLNLRDLEQGVDQLARLGGTEPDIDIAPADLPGTSNLIVHRKRVGTPFRGGFAVNNDGSASTGRIQSMASLDIDSLLGIGDFWSLYYSRPVASNSQRGSLGYGGSISFPYGYTTLTLSGGRYSFRSVLRGFDQAFANTGVSTNGSLTLDRLLFRDAKTKVLISASLSILDTINRIQGIKISTSSYRLATGTIDAHVQRHLGKGLASIGVSFTRGLDFLGANAVDTGPGGSRVTFRKIEADLGYQSRLKLFGRDLNYSGALRGALALDPVFPAERFSLGGSSTVRGFRDDGISGRRGIFTRQQLGFSLFKLFGDRTVGTQTGFSGFIGYDAGGIAPRRGDPFERGFLQAASLGLRASNNRVVSDLTVSVPLSAPATVNRENLELLTSLRILL
jgi:hemolysin activation/secretion protein